MLNNNGIKIWVSCCGVSNFHLIANDTAKELEKHSFICECNCEECTYVSQLFGKNLRLTGSEILEQERESGRYEKYSENFNEKRWEVIWPIIKCYTCGKDDVWNDLKSSPINVTIDSLRPIPDNLITGPFPLESSKDWTFCSRKCWKDAKNTKNSIFWIEAKREHPKNPKIMANLKKGKKFELQVLQELEELSKNRQFSILENTTNADFLIQNSEGIIIPIECKDWKKSSIAKYGKNAIRQAHRYVNEISLAYPNAKVPYTIIYSKQSVDYWNGTDNSMNFQTIITDNIEEILELIKFARRKQTCLL